MVVLFFDRRIAKYGPVILQQVLRGLPLGLHVGNLAVDGLRPHHGGSKNDGDVERCHLNSRVSITSRLRDNSRDLLNCPFLVL